MNFADQIKAALELVRADASKQLLPPFKAMVQSWMANPADLVNATLQFNSFLAQAAALAPSLNKELGTQIGNALINWAESQAGTNPPA